MNNLKIPSVEISSGAIDSYLKQLAGRDKVLYDKIKQLETDNQNLKNRLNSLSIMPITSTTSLGGRFTDNIDGTVTDNKTGLMWKKYPEGLSGSGYSADTAGTRFTWDEAMKRVQDINMRGGFAGYRDWRLPSIEELKSIVDKNFKKPVVNIEAFSNTPADFFWSSSSPVRSMGWLLGFTNGDCCCGYKNYSSYVRLVRGGK